MGEVALGDKGAYVGGQGMDTLIGELADIGEKLIPEMLLSFNSHVDSIKCFPGHHLVLLGDGSIVDKGLDSLSIFTLKHHFQLPPACVAVISLISIVVEGFQVI